MSQLLPIPLLLMVVIAFCCLLLNNAVVAIVVVAPVMVVVRCRVTALQLARNSDSRRQFSKTFLHNGMCGVRDAVLGFGALLGGLLAWWPSLPYEKISITM